MPRSKSRTLPAAPLPPLLVRLVHAAQHAADVDRSTDRHGHAEALAALGQLALVSVPSRGVLAPCEDELYMAIDKVAQQHLNMRKAKRAWSDALKLLTDLKVRDPIESAHLWRLSESDDAYYYAGLAFGITIADLATNR